MRRGVFGGDGCQVCDNNGNEIARTEDDVENAARLTRLPELYDALVCSVQKSCMRSCGRNKPCESPCYEVKDSIELLRKVRDGE